MSDVSEPRLCLWLEKNVRRYSRSVRLRKKYGQHLMVDCSLGLKFLSTLKSEVKPGRVLEVGTGLGFLTKFLSEVSPVVSVELDPTLARASRKVLKHTRNPVFIIEADAVRLVREGIVRADVVASNPPFNITSDLLISLVKSPYTHALLTLQKEVVDRLLAEPGSRSYGKITVIVRSFFEVRKLAEVPPKTFFPPPEVHASVVLLRRVSPWSEMWENLEKLLKCAFSQRRKLAKKVLGRCVEALFSAGLSKELTEELRDLRVFQVGVGIFQRIVRELGPVPGSVT